MKNMKFSPEASVASTCADCVSRFAEEIGALKSDIILWVIDVSIEVSTVIVPPKKVGIGKSLGSQTCIQCLQPAHLRVSFSRNVSRHSYAIIISEQSFLSIVSH